MKHVPVLLLAGLLLAGCGGTTTGATSTRSATTAAASPCLAAPAGWGPALASAATGGTGFTPTGRIAAVRAPDRAKVYLIAVEFRVTGVPAPQVGVWASNSLTPGDGLVFSVDALARQFSSLGTAPGLGEATPGVADARACLTR